MTVLRAHADLYGEQVLYFTNNCTISPLNKTITISSNVIGAYTAVFCSN